MTEYDDDFDEVRRLLADARAIEPMPDDVQARLDAVLGDLSSERTTRPAPQKAQPVVPDLSARRRRRARTLLIAAAAVVVLGVGAPRVLQSGTSSDESLASTDSAGGSAGDDSMESGPAGQVPQAPTEGDAESSEDSANAGALPPRVRPSNFAADARAARDQAARSDYAATLLDTDCLANTDVAELSAKRRIAVRYGDLEAALILGKARNGSQEAALYVCGESSPRRTALLSAR